MQRRLKVSRLTTSYPSRPLAWPMSSKVFQRYILYYKTTLHQFVQETVPFLLTAVVELFLVGFCLAELSTKCFLGLMEQLAFSNYLRALTYAVLDRSCSVFDGVLLTIGGWSNQSTLVQRFGIRASCIS